MHPTVAIVTTLRDAGDVLASFITYHLSIGFDRLFLFFDDPEDPAIALARHYQEVTVLPYDETLVSLWKSTTLYASTSLAHFVDTEVMARQILNAEVAISLALEQNIDWLLHIDSDELFYAPGESVPAHFASLSAQNIQCVSYPNYEAVPELVDIENYFKEVTLFKRYAPAATLDALNARQIALIETTPQLPPLLFHFYRNGKSAAQVCRGLIPQGVHDFMPPAGQQAILRTESPIILHYPCCGFKHFWNKYTTLGPLANAWFGSTDITMAIGPTHLDSSAAVQTGDRAYAQSFYQNRFVISDPVLIQALIAQGLCCRITAPATLLQASVV